MENKNIEIFASVVYKELMTKSLDGNINFDILKDHVQSLITAVSSLAKNTSVPFNNPPARGVPAVGDTCKDCGSPLRASKNRGGKPWCYDCWKKNKGL